MGGLTRAGRPLSHVGSLEVGAIVGRVSTRNSREEAAGLGGGLWLCETSRGRNGAILGAVGAQK